MAALDIEAWAGPVSDAEPSGPSLEFDGDFGALDRASQGKPEQQYGTTIVPAEEPDWKEMDTLAVGLMARTRDLRVLGHLTVARLRLGGMVEYAALLGLAQRWIETFWDSLHPQLDPEDDNDPTLRGNALLQVANPAWVVRFLRDLPLARSPRVGSFSWRQIAMATGQIPGGGGDQAPTEAAIRGAFLESDPAQREALRGALVAARAALKGISDGFDTAAGSGAGPNFEEIEKLLHEMARMMERYSPAEAEAAPAEAEAVADLVAVPGAPGAPPAGGVSAASLTAIQTRADALRLLDLVCEYYEKAEPSSPLPLLIARARRLADMPFLDILRDLAPDGLGQARMNTGVREG